MRTGIALILIQVALSACSSLDFFQYRENTGLYVVEKPDGYGTSKFGTQIAVSGNAEEEYMAISAGPATSSLFYRLSRDGKMQDASDYFLDYPGDATEFVSIDAVTRTSGSALAGLPLFAQDGQRIDGCTAVGEPGVSEITLWCSSLDGHTTIEGDRSLSNFGSVLSTIRLDGGTQFLLIGGGTNGFQLFGDIIDGTGRRSVMVELPDRAELQALSGGRLDGDPGAKPLYVAAGTTSDDGLSFEVYLYEQSGTDFETFEQIGCLQNEDNAGFGGVLLSRDLDSDGVDELIVGSADGTTPHKNEVRIFDVAAIAAALNGESSCIDISSTELPTLATIGPEDGDFDVECADDCGFGASLAVGDIATDDDGPELVIGAYHADVEGTSDAGAVYIFRGFERTESDDSDTFAHIDLASQVFDSTPESGKAFGAALEIAPIAGRNELLISATGEGKVFIAFCTGVGEDIRQGADVPRDAEGKVVSTRCRL